MKVPPLRQLLPALALWVLLLGGGVILFNGLRRRPTDWDAPGKRAEATERAQRDSLKLWTRDSAHRAAIIRDLDRQIHSHDSAAAAAALRASRAERTRAALALDVRRVQDALARAANTRDSLDAATRLLILRRGELDACDSTSAARDEQAHRLAAARSACQTMSDTLKRERDEARARLRTAIAAADTGQRARDVDKCRLLVVTIPCPELQVGVSTSVNLDPAVRIGVGIPLRRFRVHF